MTHIFASDFDGTLYKDHIIRESDLEAIAAFREQGHKFGLVTGRSVDSILAEAEKHNIPYDFVIGINGGAVLTHDHQEIFRKTLSQEISTELAQKIDDFGIEFYGVTDGYRLARVYGNPEARDSFEPNIQTTPVEEILEVGARGFYVNAGSEEHALALSIEINNHFKNRGVQCFPNVSAVDIGVEGVTKATGIQSIIDHYGYAGSVYTIGDSYNDLPMIKAFHGFAMDNGVDAVKKHAQNVVATVGDALKSVTE